MSIVTIKAAVSNVGACCPITVPSMESSALARKRRREKLVGSLSSTPDEVMSNKVVKVESDYSSDDSTRQGKGSKRPQMKYEPEIPMTKEEASVWRREQRRKRNRESAAACRKRQRDRIAELEIEVGEWKAKFDKALAKLNEIEGGANSQVNVDVFCNAAFDRCDTPVSDNVTGDLMSPCECISSGVPKSHQTNYVSPCSGRNFVHSAITPSTTYCIPSLEDTVEAPFVFGQLPSETRVETGQHLKEIITRPAKSRLFKSRRRRLNFCTASFPTQ
mmetsp:Transcript_4198/g.8295  ORF Transcript_4198/g.8295 Transcript_4198/m.8295 type:complete len:275 (+) Transcript_4198:139-963(+)